jgi:hypothetical protein
MRNTPKFEAAKVRQNNGRAKNKRKLNLALTTKGLRFEVYGLGFSGVTVIFYFVMTIRSKELQNRNYKPKTQIP